MSPFELGGQMIRKVTVEKTTWNRSRTSSRPARPIAEAVGLAVAIDYVTDAGLAAIGRHEHELTEYALGRLGEIPGLRLYGPPADRRSGSSRSASRRHPHDVAQIVDAEGVAVRAGTTATSR